MKYLGALGGRENWAYGVNDAGQVASCFATRNGVEHAFVYDSDGRVKDLGTLGGLRQPRRRHRQRGQVVGLRR